MCTLFSGREYYSQVEKKKENIFISLIYLMKHSSQSSMRKFQSVSITNEDAIH